MDYNFQEKLYYISNDTDKLPYYFTIFIYFFKNQSVNKENLLLKKFNIGLSYRKRSYSTASIITTKVNTN